MQTGTPYAESGALTTDSEELVEGDNKLWDTESDWNAAQSMSNIEVTSSGSLVLAQLEMIDDFEDNELSAYSTIGGGNWEITDTNAIEGIYSLLSDLDQASDVLSTSGLGTYPQHGDTIRYQLLIQSGDSQGDRAEFHFALDSETEVTGYSVRVSQRDSEFLIREVTSGTPTGLDTVSVSVPQDEILEVEIEWLDTKTATLYDSSGTEIASVSGTDTQHDGNTGIGFGQRSGDSDGSIFDSVRIV